MLLEDAYVERQSSRSSNFYGHYAPDCPSTATMLEDEVINIRSKWKWSISMIKNESFNETANLDSVDWYLCMNDSSDFVGEGPDCHAGDIVQRKSSKSLSKQGNKKVMQQIVQQRNHSSSSSIQGLLRTPLKRKQEKNQFQEVQVCQEIYVSIAMLGHAIIYFVFH